ncbi:MAG: zinc ribbon domain-containing protein [Coriobacteriales bacterium]
MKPNNAPCQEVAFEAAKKLRGAGNRLSKWGTEERRKAFLIVSACLCVGYFLPVYYVDFHASNSFASVDLNSTFSLFQLMSDPEDFNIDEENAWSYIIYLIAPAAMALLSYHWKRHDLFKYAFIPSALYLVLFCATRHVAAEARYQQYFGLSLIGVIYLIALAVATAIAIWEFVELRKRAKGASAEEKATASASQDQRHNVANSDAQNYQSAAPATHVASRPENQRPAAQPHFCFKCGAPLGPSDRFCGTCGQKVEGA